ncbi:pyridoxamine 5'-phosphate oxidase family protein [Aquisediminimonas profunda]|uniref:pyridoxamine 5'-phosphate oxidase family protein n=1 Tax=Aquisediminimonas profunda TaxID=1550733 RepID=UPI001C634022|nr:pyridoxamine 5'-phosphate oxidase family protein [Aquisediminimonas profunda]
MAQNYVLTLFTETARALQEADGSRTSYARMEAGASGEPDQLTDREAEFIAARDSFYLASVTSEGWPYVQHRGGPAGFLKLLPGNRLAFADYRGNRQHVSTANLTTEPRVSLFLMDYPNRRRLKILGRARIVQANEDPALVASLMPDSYQAIPERAYVIDVVGYDWNCPQHITPRFTEVEISQAIRPLTTEITQLRAEIERLRAQAQTLENGDRK